MSHAGLRSRKSLRTFHTSSKGSAGAPGASRVDPEKRTLAHA